MNAISPRRHFVKKKTQKKNGRGLYHGNDKTSARAVSPARSSWLTQTLPPIKNPNIFTRRLSLRRDKPHLTTTNASRRLYKTNRPRARAARASLAASRAACTGQAGVAERGPAPAMDPNAESDVRRLVGLSKLGEALQVGLAAAAAEGDDAAREAALKMLMQVLTGACVRACVRVGPARRLQPGRVSSSH